MCGIVGVSTTHLSISEREIFEDLMTVSNLRGSQGAGIATWSHLSGEAHRVRTQHNGINLINSGPYHDLFGLQGDRPSTLIGHTRAPTRGGIEIENVHPHNFDDIIGVHNGTMHQIDGKGIPVGFSDSYELYRTINDKGLQSFVQNSGGAYALVWINKEQETLNFFRNSERPLWFAWVYGGMTMFWASEKSMLEFVLGRKNYKDVRFEELPPYEHRVFDLAEKGEVKPASIEEVRKTYKFQAGQTMGTAYGDRGWDWNDGNYDLAEWEENVEKWSKDQKALKGETKPAVIPIKSVISNVTRPENDEKIVADLRSRPIKWIHLGKAVSSGSDHGVPVSCKGVGEARWQMTWSDGAVSEYDHYPYYIWRPHVEALNNHMNQAEARKNSLAERMREHKAKKEAAKATVPPFGPGSSEPSASSNDKTVSLDAGAEATLDCSLEERRQSKQADLDVVFGTKPLDMDTLPWSEVGSSESFFERAHARANGQRGPRISKKEKRRVRALERLQASKMQEDIAQVQAESAGYRETIRNIFIAEASYQRAMQSGCSSCGFNGADPGEVTWHKRDEFLCGTCSLDDETRLSAGLQPLGPTVH